MAGHEGHFSIGLLFYPLFFLLWNLVFNLVDADLGNFFDSKIVIIGIFVYSIGSILPDVDVQSSLIHRIVRNLLIVPSSIGFFYYLLIKFSMVNHDFNVFTLFLETVLIYISIIGGFIIGRLFKVSMKHRGFLHSPFSSVIYGAIVFVILVVLGFETYDSLFIGIIAASGYLVHIFTDYISPLFRRRR